MLTAPAPSPGPGGPVIDPGPIQTDPMGWLQRFMAWDGAWPLIVAVVLTAIGIGVARRHLALFAFLTGTALGFFVGSVL